MNMFTLADGRRAFHQWDTGRQLIVHDTTCTEAHFSNGHSGSSLVCKVFDQGELRVVNVPNILLQDTRSITVFGFVEEDSGGYTRRAVVFPVRPRPKPEDYVYTETEVLSYSTLAARVEALEKAGVSETEIAEAVEKYLDENPIETGVQFETDGTLTLQDGVLSVNTTNDMEQDNTLPITSAGVFATVGNIEALLKTI